MIDRFQNLAKPDELQLTPCRPKATNRSLASARVVVCAGAALEGRKLRVAVVGGGPAGLEVWHR